MLPIATHMTAIGVLIAALLITPAQAGHRDRQPEHRRHHQYDYAKVINATPVYRTITHSQPRHECHEETVPYPGSRKQHNSATGTIVGTIVGAAIGNAIGHNKTNKRIGMVAGGLLGGSIGRDISATAHHRTHRYNDHNSVGTFCQRSYDTYQEQRLDGYRVTYRYHGQTYETRMDHRPGRRIRVRIDVTPVD